jgi:hypothetical protein
MQRFCRVIEYVDANVHSCEKVLSERKKARLLSSVDSSFMKMSDTFRDSQP